jgi:hypothetical protein
MYDDAFEARKPPLTGPGVVIKKVCKHKDQSDGGSRKKKVRNPGGPGQEQLSFRHPLYLSVCDSIHGKIRDGPLFRFVVLDQSPDPSAPVENQTTIKLPIQGSPVKGEPRIARYADGRKISE